MQCKLLVVVLVRWCIIKWQLASEFLCFSSRKSLAPAVSTRRRKTMELMTRTWDTFFAKPLLDEYEFIHRDRLI